MNLVHGTFYEGRIELDSPVNCTVVTKDTDFAAVPGLVIENWSGAK